MWKWLFLLILWIPRQILSYLKLISSRKRYPPGPFPLPVMGSMWRLLGTGVSEATFRKLAKQYGNICSLWGGPYHIIILSGYQAVKEGLIDHSEAFADRPVTPFVLASTQKKGIVFSNGHTWEQQRQFSAVTLRKLGTGNKGMESQIQEEAQELAEFFAETKGQPFDPSLPIMTSVCRVICALAFGHRFSIDDKDFLELMKAISTALKFGGSTFYLLYEAFPHIMNHLPGPHQTALSAVETIVSFARKEITLHQEKRILHEPQDFIDFYLFEMEKRKDDPNSTYNEDNLAYCIADLFVAGTDTTSSSLTWAMLLMANDLDVQDKVHKEMDEVFGSLPSISYKEQKKLPYTNAVIHEIIRKKYAFLFGIPRQCVQDVYLNGLLIPKGAAIVPDLRSVLLDPEHWEAPEEFNPNHFLDKAGNFMEKDAFLPFGAGARACLGELLAKKELFNFLTRLLRAFRLEPPKGVEKLHEKSVIGVSVHPSPYKICALPRITTP